MWHTGCYDGTVQKKRWIYHQGCGSRSGPALFGSASEWKAGSSPPQSQIHAYRNRGSKWSHGGPSMDSHNGGVEAWRIAWETRITLLRSRIRIRKKSELIQIRNQSDTADPQTCNRQLFIVLELTNVNAGAGTDNLSCFPVVHFPRIRKTYNRSITKRIR